MFLFIINLYRIVPAYFLSKISHEYKIILLDLERWKEKHKVDGSNFYCFGYMLLKYKEYRNLVSYRIKKNSRIKSAIFKILFKPMDTLYIHTPDIGAGLYIQHGFSTIISAKSIGENCHIYQQVTIGYNGSETPVIGDNVRICCGAKVIGGINVGDNSVIGAGAVVVKDVGANEVHCGVPAKCIKMQSIDN